MPTTEIILTEKVYNLGAEADVVKVKAGYARNFLIPQGKALEVTPTTLRRLNILKAKRAEREAKEMNDAQEVARKISKIKLEIELETGETGKAFGSVTAADIAQKLQAALGGGIEIDRHKIEVNITAKGAAPAAKADGEAEGDKTPGSYKAKAKAKHKTAKTDSAEAKE